MVNKRFWLGMLVMTLAFGMMVVGCDVPTDDNDDDSGNKTPKNAIELTANVWSDGTVPDGGEQWFKFTASASTQYFHVIFGTMNNMDIQLYSNSGNALGNALHLRSGRGDNYESFSVSSGQVYYVKITRGTVYQYDSSTSGTYRITFNSVQFTPGTFDVAVSLYTGVWADGNILVNGEQWFKFTANASTQYFHVIFGTMDNMDIRLYSNSGDALGNASNLRSGRGNNYTPLIVTNGQVYYVRVTQGSVFQYDSSTSGTYQIAFNNSSTPPSDDW
ncbi:MAG: hypothetical protein LBH20_02120 [Treponema sp.]|jgi:hypothetical protein|nr:hypothetical protein [Treponema sp.]